MTLTVKIKQYYIALTIAAFVIAIILLTFTINPGAYFALGEDAVSSKTYSFGGPKNINMLPIVANKLGYFEKHNLSIMRQDIQTGKITMDALIKGDIDFGVLVETNIAFIKFQGDPGIEVIAIIEEKFDDAIMANKNRGILSAKDLEGKRIGITASTTSHAFAVFYLKKQGIDLSKVEFVNMPPPSIQAALINGNLDAGSLWQPFRYNVEKELGENTLTFNDKDAYKAYAIITVRKDFSREHPEVVQKFLRALIDAEDYYKKHPGEVKEMLSQELNIPLEILEAVWGEYNLEISFKKELFDTIKDEAKWIIETEDGFKEKPMPNYGDSFNPSFLAEIDQLRVNWQ